MEIVLSIVGPIILAIGIICIFGFSRRERARRDESLNRRDFVARSTYTWGIIMCTINALLLSVVIAGNIEKPFPLGVNIVLGGVILLFGYGILQSFRERVRIIEGKDIIYTPTIGRKRTYLFSQIDGVEKKKTGVYVYVNGKRAFSLDPSGIGTTMFLELYRDRPLSSQMKPENE